MEGDISFRVQRPVKRRILHASLRVDSGEVSGGEAEDVGAVAEIHGVPFEFGREIENAVFVPVDIRARKHERVALPFELLAENFCPVRFAHQLGITLAGRNESKMNAGIFEFGTENIVEDLAETHGVVEEVYKLDLPHVAEPTVQILNAVDLRMIAHEFQDSRIIEIDEKGELLFFRERSVLFKTEGRTITQEEIEVGAVGAE